MYYDESAVKAYFSFSDIVSVTYATWNLFVDDAHLISIIVKCL